MTTSLVASLVLALTSAFAAVVLGRNLTRSLGAAFAFVAALGFALLAAGMGFLALVVVILAALILATIQLFGWMLVDVDRDHLAPTDKPTWVARGLAFLLLGGGLVLLLVTALDGGELGTAASSGRSPTPAEVGLFFFGSMPEAAVLIGFAIASSLLATLLLLNDDGENE